MIKKHAIYNYAFTFGGDIHRINIIHWRFRCDLRIDLREGLRQKIVFDDNSSNESDVDIMKSTFRGYDSGLERDCEISEENFDISYSSESVYETIKTEIKEYEVIEKTREIEETHTIEEHEEYQNIAIQKNSGTPLVYVF